MLPSEPPCSGIAVRRPRILLVDDDPSVIRALWRLLRRNRPHFQVNSASSATQAGAALSELSFDAVVTDMQMPGGGGRVVLELLRKYHPETARILHASQLEASETAELRGLAHVILAKPAREAELLAALDTSLALVAGPNQAGGARAVSR